MLIDSMLSEQFSRAALLASGGNWQAAYELLRQTQQTVVQQERLQASGQMASGFAHDLNNSLTPIIGYADFLLDTETALPDDARKYLQCIRSAAGDIARRVEQVRQFYRQRDQDETLNLVDLNQISRQVLEALQLCGSKFQKMGIPLEIETRWNESLPGIREDTSEVREAVSSLILNAIEAMPKGGVLSIATHCESESIGPPRGPRVRQVILEVTDTGIGMDEPTRSRCLEPFFSTKGPRRRGLGLSMVYGLMRRHGGDIQIRSQPGQGTTVRLLFNPADMAARWTAIPGHHGELPSEVDRVVKALTRPTNRPARVSQGASLRDP